MTTDERQEMYDVGMADEDLRVGRLLPLGTVAVPRHLRLSDDRSTLLWRWAEPEGDGEDAFTPVDVRVPPRDLLDRFVKIRTADQVLAFARVEGVLGLCGHGPLPASHAPTPWGIWETEGARDAAPALFGCRPTQEEPIEEWVAAADFLGRLLSFAASLHSTRRRSGAAAEDLRQRGVRLLWASTQIDAYGMLSVCSRIPHNEYVAGFEASARRLLSESEPSNKYDAWRPSIVGLRMVVERIVNQLSALAGVGAFLQWEDSAPAWRLHAGGAPDPLWGTDFRCGLPGALVIQVAAAVAREKAKIPCNGCGRDFEPQRARQPGAAFCQREGCRREAQRIASAEHRARKAAGLEPLRTRKARKGRKARNP